MEFDLGWCYAYYNQGLLWASRSEPTLVSDFFCIFVPTIEQKASPADENPMYKLYSLIPRPSLSFMRTCSVRVNYK